MVIKGLRKGNCDFKDLRYCQKDIISTRNNNKKMPKRAYSGKILSISLLRYFGLC
jgi:hypothetical protein